jgi:hypothetical protein
LPSLRLDPQGQSTTGTNPGRTANTSGVVVKRRIHDGFRQRYGVEAWFRFTSTNLTSNTFFSMSIYNRDGTTSAYHARLWFDPNGNNVPLVCRILDGSATAAGGGTNPASTAVYTPVATSVSQNGAGSHMFYPASGRMDRAGGWHYAKMVVDFSTLKYVSLQIDGETITDLSAYNMDITDSTGFAGMHHSFELSATTTTRPRWVNVAHMIGTVED